MKIKILLLLIVNLNLFFLAEGQSIPELMYFKFNGTGTSVPNEANSITIVSSTGTINGATQGITCQFGGALNGNGGITTTNSLNAGWPLNLSGPLTISMWFSGMTSTLTSNYLFGGSGGSTFRAMTGTGLVSGGGNIMVRGTGLTDITANGVFNATGTPVVVHFVYDNVSSVKVYANGVLINTIAQSANIVLTGTDFTVGGQATSNGLPVGGKMDEFRLYNRALSAAEIAGTWNIELGTTPGGGGNPLLFNPIANFAYDKGIDTVWVNSPYAFINTSTGDSADYWRIEVLPGATNCVATYGCYQQAGVTRNFRYTFTDTGSYLVTLVVRNRTGRDSLSKWVYVGYPSKKPLAKFFMDKQTIGVSEQIPVYDLSENGPTSWQWTVSPYCRTCATDPRSEEHTSELQSHHDL